MQPLNSTPYNYGTKSRTHIENKTDFTLVYFTNRGRIYFEKPPSRPVIDLRAYRQELGVNHFYFQMWPDDVNIKIQYISKDKLLITTKRETGAINNYSFHVNQTVSGTSLSQYWT